MTGARSARPLIGLTLGHDSERPAVLRIRQTYPRAVLGAGGVPVLIPPMDDVDALHQLFRTLHGIIFPGGLDVHPRYFGEGDRVHETTTVDEELDTLELRLAEWSVADGLPTLGICRGHQLLNVAMGGTLIQDLPSEGYAQVQHKHEGQRTDLTHDLRVDDGSRLAALLGVPSCQVNSFHHQAIRELGPGLTPVAWSPDGIVEGFEGTDHPWLLSVQFHPEELVGFHEPSQRLFKGLIEACH